MQVQAVFKLKSKDILPSYLTATPLCYVHYFQLLLLSVSWESIRLHQVECMHPSIAPPTGIIPLTHVIQPLDFIPVLNTAFSDKETFHALHHWLLLSTSYAWLRINNDILLFISASGNCYGFIINNLTCHVVTGTHNCDLTWWLLGWSKVRSHPCSQKENKTVPFLFHQLEAGQKPWLTCFELSDTKPPDTQGTPIEYQAIICIFW